MVSAPSVLAEVLALLEERVIEEAALERTSVGVELVLKRDIPRISIRCVLVADDGTPGDRGMDLCAAARARAAEPLHAVWSGEVFGVQVHVLSNGQRVVDAESFEKWFASGDERSTAEACDGLAAWVAATANNPSTDIDPPPPEFSQNFPPLGDGEVIVAWGGLGFSDASTAAPSVRAEHIDAARSARQALETLGELGIDSSALADLIVSRVEQIPGSAELVDILRAPLPPLIAARGTGDAHAGVEVAAGDLVPCVAVTADEGEFVDCHDGMVANESAAGQVPPDCSGDNQ